MKRFYEHELRACRRAWKANNLAGLYDGLIYALEEATLEERALGYTETEIGSNSTDLVEVERWVLEGAIGWIRNEIRANARTCPTQSWLRRHLRDIRDEARSEAVDAVRESEQVPEVNKKWTDGRVYEQAAIFVAMLDDAETHGTAGAVEGSYKRYRKHQRREPGRHYSSRFMNLGPPPHRERPGKP